MSDDNMVPPLTDKQEMLLAKHHDGECSFIERFFAQRLMKAHPCAARYLDSIKSTQSIVRTLVPLESPNLWTRISIRLHAEERSAVMLGKRHFDGDRSRFALPVWKTAAVGAFAAAFLVAVVPIERSPELTTAARNGSKSSQQFIPDISLVGAQSGGEPVRMLSRRIPNAVEVDWMRSDGRLRVMNEAEERAPIIWVKRRARKSIMLRSERNSSDVVMVEPRTPRGIAISNK